VRTASHFNAKIEVSCNGVSVGGTSIMGLMMLGAGAGSNILVKASGQEANQALEAIAELVTNGFDEDEDGIKK
jgi:phosphocarrier protein